MASEHSDTLLMAIQVGSAVVTGLAVLGRKLRLARQFEELTKDFRSLRDDVREDLADFRRELREVKRAPVSRDSVPVGKVRPLRNGSDE